jgi:predicted nucleic acid-binding protein
VIFVDSNIPMYLVGGPHSNKSAAQHWLERLSSERQRLVSDAEVLQEIMHRFAAIHRRDAIQPAFSALLKIVDDVFPVDRKAVERAKDILLGYPQLSARDAVHIAVMELNGVDTILTFDSDFDAFPGITRLS